MNDLIEQSRPALNELCRRFGVRRLYLFGSAVNGTFKPPSSDFDFLVELNGREPTRAYAHRYLDLAESLERLFGRPVDLVSEPSIRNPYLRNEIESSRQLLYVDSDQETPV